MAKKKDEQSSIKPKKADPAGFLLCELIENKVKAGLLPKEVLEDEDGWDINCEYFAKQLGISVQQFQDFICGEYRLTVEFAMELEKHFGIDVQTWVDAEIGYRKSRWEKREERPFARRSDGRTTVVKRYGDSILIEFWSNGRVLERLAKENYDALYIKAFGSAGAAFWNEIDKACEG